MSKIKSKEVQHRNNKENVFLVQKPQKPRLSEEAECVAEQDR